MTSSAAILADDTLSGLREGWRRAASRWAEQAGLELTAVDAAPADELPAIVERLGTEVETIILARGGPGEDGSRTLAATLDGVRARVVHVDLEHVDPDLAAADPVRSACARTISGRGFAGLWSALHHAASWSRWEPERIAYGQTAAQVGELRRPDGDGPSPVAVLVHGGLFRPEWELDTLDRLAVTMAEEGWATWNVEYRRLRGTGGGWPQTLDDVEAAVDHVATLSERHAWDTERVVFVGHSVGATLVLAAAARAQAQVVPRAVVSLSGLLDVRQAVRTRLGDGDVLEMFGRPEDHPDRYSRGDPLELLPLGVPLVVAHGDDDAIVPAAVSRSFAVIATGANEEIEEVFGPGSHFDPLDPGHELWSRSHASLCALTEG